MPCDTPTEWETALQDYCNDLRAAGRSAGTIKLRSHYIGRLRRAYANRSPWSLTGDQLVTFMASGEWSPETRKSARASLCGFYGWAFRAGRIPADPSIRLAPVNVPAGVPRPAPNSVLARALLVADSDRERLILLHAAYAGLRRGEIARVRPSDYTEQGLRVRGKGGRVRVVPVHPDLAAAVRAELEKRAAGGCGTGYRYRSGISLEGPLFPNAAGEPVSPDVIGKLLSRRLGSGWTGHTLRHRFASVAYAAERDLRAVQELLGHSNPQTTARYVQTPADAKRTAVAAVGVVSAA